MFPMCSAANRQRSATIHFVTVYSVAVAKRRLGVAKRAAGVLELMV
jgi:hypothetical protein